jgi:SAM-dependent methyltransferase
VSPDGWSDRALLLILAASTEVPPGVLREYCGEVADWWQSFFDADYLKIWEASAPPDKTEREVTGLWELLGLAEGAAVLDAPCGYGRIARGLAVRGARVLGVDQSAMLLAEAERLRDGLPTERLGYLRHDLRQPLPASGFDVALNIYSSLGYGTDADDVAILSNLRAALRPGGRLFVETMHRDRAIANLVQDRNRSDRLPDGTLLREEPQFDPVAGRMHTTWYWQGPAGGGQKTGSFRVYTATEVVRMLEAAGLTVRSVHDGCSDRPFVAAGAAIGGRLGVLAVRE